MNRYLLDEEGKYVEQDDEAKKHQQEFDETYNHVEELARALAITPARQLLFEKLEECFMWAGKAIRDDQVYRTSKKG